MLLAVCSLMDFSSHHSHERVKHRAASNKRNSGTNGSRQETMVMKSSTNGSSSQPYRTRRTVNDNSIGELRKVSMVRIPF